MRSYGSVLRYQCGLARRFYDPDLDLEYDERNMTCNWNKTWTTRDYIDECIWVACLYPPEPPAESLLYMVWSGEPVEFYGNVSYTCQEEGLYFEMDREMTEYNMTCQPGGTWELPSSWPVCVPCRPGLGDQYTQRYSFQRSTAPVSHQRGRPVGPGSGRSWTVWSTARRSPTPAAPTGTSRARTVSTTWWSPPAPGTRPGRPARWTPAWPPPARSSPSHLPTSGCSTWRTRRTRSRWSQSSLSTTPSWPSP